MINFLEMPMNYDTSTQGKDLDLTQFACRFLKDQGAILESGNEVTNVLLPKNLSQALDVEEYIIKIPDKTLPDTEYRRLLDDSLEKEVKTYNPAA